MKNVMAGFEYTDLQKFYITLYGEEKELILLTNGKKMTEALVIDGKIADPTTMLYVTATAQNPATQQCLIDMLRSVYKDRADVQALLDIIDAHSAGRRGGSARRHVAQKNGRYMIAGSPAELHNTWKIEPYGTMRRFRCGYEPVYTLDDEELPVHKIIYLALHQEDELADAILTALKLDYRYDQTVATTIAAMNHLAWLE